MYSGELEINIRIFHYSFKQTRRAIRVKLQCRGMNLESSAQLTVFVMWFQNCFMNK